MSIWAIVPVKPFKQAKSRLASELSPEERESLSRNFLTHTLEVLSRVKRLNRISVVSRDMAVLSAARKQNAHTITESSGSDLNMALTLAADIAISFGAHALLIIPSDLPLLTAPEVTAFIEQGEQSERMSLTVAPDRREEGTNGLFLRPPRLIPYGFGEASFSTHVFRARWRRAQVEICRLPGFALDVDTPEDLALYRSSLGEHANANGQVAV
jgi:2-phospho-L-lactate guanylyltransferase